MAVVPMAAIGVGVGRAGFFVSEMDVNLCSRLMRAACNFFSNAL